MTLSQRLAAVLEQKGWQPNKLDREAKLSAGSTKRYLQGHEPSQKSLRLLAAFLGVPAGALVNEEEPPPPAPDPAPHEASQ